MIPLKKHCYSLIFFLSFLNPVFSQTYIADSIRNLLPMAKPGYDELDYRIGLVRAIFIDNDYEEMQKELAIAIEKAKAYDDLGAQAYLNVFKSYVTLFVNGNVNASMQLTKEAMDLAEKSGDKDAQTFAIYQYAENLSYEKSQYQEAIDLLQASIDQVDSTVTQKNIGNTYKNIAYAHSQLGSYPKALDAYEKAVAIFRKVATEPDINHRLGRVSAMYMDGGIFNLGQTLVYLAGTYEKMGRLKETEENLLKAYQLFDNAQQDIGDHLAWTAGKLGAFYPKIGDYQKAIRYLQESGQNFEDLGLLRDQMDTQILLGDVFVKIEEKKQATKAYAQALNYFKSNQDTIRYLKVAIKQAGAYSEQSLNKSKKLLQEAFKMANAMQDQSLVAAIYREEARNLVKEGDLVAARVKLEQVVDIAVALNDQARQAEALLGIADIYQKQENFVAASQTAEKSRTASQNIKRSDLVSQANAFLSKSYEAQGDFQKALLSFRAYEGYQDSILNEQTQSIIREEQVRQNVKAYQAEQEIAELRAQALSSRNRQYLLLAGALFLILLIGGYLFVQLRQTKAALQIQNIQLQELNTTKDRFFGIIAHDIRSPIIALDGVGKQMNFYLKKGKTEKLERLTSLIDDTAGRLSTLLDNLLNWALLQTKQLPYQPEEIKLVDTIDRTIKLFEPLAEVKQIDLKMQMNSASSIFADESAFSTVLRNLLSNALKFTAQNGTIELKVIEQESEVEFQIKDTGVGIPPESLTNLYKLDKKSKRGTQGEKGTGLGLMLCQELLGLHGQELKVESQVGVGSTFKFSMTKI